MKRSLPAKSTSLGFCNAKQFEVQDVLKVLVDATNYSLFKPLYENLAENIASQLDVNFII